MAKAYVQIKPDMSEIEQLKTEIKDLNEALEKANRLFDQLASRGEVKVSLRFTAGDE